MAPKTKRRPKFRVQLETLFSCVAAERCSREAALHYLLVDNRVNVSIPRNTSYHAEIKIIASSAPLSIPIDSLSTELEQKGMSPRGNTRVGNAADCIDLIASNCLSMRWWITEQGLVVDRLEPESNLSDFDVAAGGLMLEHFKNGRLPKKSLTAIAQILDERQFSLKSQLQPSFWKKIAEYNQRYPKSAIKTFQRALEYRPHGRTAVRKALYAARDRFLRSQNGA